MAKKRLFALVILICVSRRAILNVVSLSVRGISAPRLKINLAHDIGRAKSGSLMSLVKNINKRKAAGTSRPKSKSTVSDKAYKDMQKGWPKKKAKK